MGWYVAAFNRLLVARRRACCLDIMVCCRQQLAPELAFLLVVQTPAAWALQGVINRFLASSGRRLRVQLRGDEHDALTSWYAAGSNWLLSLPFCSQYRHLRLGRCKSEGEAHRASSPPPCLRRN